MSTRWRVLPHDPNRIAALSHAANVPALIAQVLLNRGISEAAAAKEYLEARMTFLHDPGLLPGATEAADRIVRAVRDGRKVVIYGDYDVDGVCGTSLLWSCLRLAGARDAAYYIPHRVEEGYGVNPDAIRKIANELGASLVVTVDCGISAIAEAKLARELGLELIVTDHHTPGHELPEADVIVHPRLALEGGTAPYPCPDLCGAAVAFKVAWQVCKAFGDGKKASPHLRDFLVRSLGLVAMATIADIVPLSGENRVLVRHGLHGIDKSPSVGLHALMEVSGALGRRKLTAGTVSFGLAPRINAAGRLERAMRAVEMLTTEDTAFAREIAGELDEANTRRQTIEQTIVSEAHEMIRAAGGVGERGALVVGREGWHPGVIGIVASRLVETYHRPAVVVALDPALSQGSARSVPGFDLYEAIAACSGGLTSFGGHKAAAGLRLPGANFQAFADRFDQHCRETLTAEQRHKLVTIDAEVSLGQLTLRIVEELENLEPFGIGNPRPILMSSRLRILGEPKVVGERKNHVQLRVSQGNLVVKAIAWNMADRFKKVGADAVCDLAFHPSINEWNNRREVQLEVKDFRLTDAEADPADRG